MRRVVRYRVLRWVQEPGPPTNADESQLGGSFPRTSRAADKAAVLVEKKKREKGKLNPEPFLLKKVGDEDDKDEHRQDQDREPNHGK